MAEQTPDKKPERKPDSQPTAGGVRPMDAGPAGAPGAAAPGAAHSLTSRRRQYMIAPKPQTTNGVSALFANSAALQPLALNVLEENLKMSGDVEVIDRITPPGVLGAFASGQGSVPSILVAKMPEEKARALKTGAAAQVHVEEDHPLSYQEPGPQLSPMEQIGVAIPPGAGFVATVTVLGNGRPVEGAQVYLFGSVLPAQGVTDANGQATLQLMGDAPNTVRALYVKPKFDYWSFFIERPVIDPNGPNVVQLTAFGDSMRDFPQTEVMGWGQKAMRLDQVPANYRGAGIKVAVVDSGAAITHADLAQVVKLGFDVMSKSREGWENDTVFHGTHCIGVISGSANGQGIRGFAPDAHVIACKIFPGGAFSSLISALDFCMDQAVDVINLSLGSSERSEIVEQRLLRAKQMGIACIVAAGNSGGPVQYPATSPNVLAVAAIGKQGEFPQDSYHTQTLSDGAQGDFFSAKFSCFGPEIAVCGPGVAVLSSVPPNNYAAWDGTSMAAPHITGLAALILAHHEDFKNRFRERNAARVDRLFEILRQSARPVGVNDRTRVGAGMPDAVRALGLEAAATTADASNDLLKRLLAALQQGGMVQPGIPAPVAMDQLRQRLAAAGILGNVPQAAAAATGAAGQQQFAAQSFGMPQYGNIGAQQPVDVRGALDRLRASMQDAQLIK